MSAVADILAELSNRGVVVRADGETLRLRPKAALARYGKEGQPQKLVPKVSQEMLAEMVGTTRPRINMFMNKFRKLGFIHYNGGLEVHDSLLSIILHD